MATMLTAWEYWVDGVDLPGFGETRSLVEVWIDRLNELGAAGWELVAETYAGSAAKPTRFQGTFKRPKA